MRRSIVLIASIVVLTACGPGAEIPRGRELYLAYGCAACHGENADGNGPAAGLASFRPRDLTNLAKYAGPTSVEGIASTIAFGVAEGRTGMPGYPDIPKRERIAIAQYLHELAEKNSGVPRVRNLWVRALIPPQDTTAAYLAIENPRTTPISLVSVTSPSARVVELHVMKTEEGHMTMRQVQKLDIPPGEFAVMQPGGAHLMLIGFQPAEEVELRLIFGDGTILNVKAPVRDVE